MRISRLDLRKVRPIQRSPIWNAFSRATLSTLDSECLELLLKNRYSEVAVFQGKLLEHSLGQTHARMRRTS